MAKQAIPIRGRVAAVTGGARGIGLSIATALTRKGARVAIGDLDLELAEKAAEKLGGGAVAFDLDVTDRESFTNFIDSAEEAVGPLDILVNNAGIMPVGPFLEESDDTALRQFDINVHGVIYGMKIVLPRMLERRRGHVVNIASQAGKGGFPGIASYCGTKHAVIGISEAVRGELRETPIELTVVMPAFVNTELISGADRPRAVKVAEPEDVANAVVAALEVPKFDVHVPKSTGTIGWIMNMVPRSGREAIARALKADQVLVNVNSAERAAYEERISHAERSREPTG